MKWLTPILLPSIGFLIPMLAGLITSVVTDALKTLSDRLDLAPSYVKQAIAALIALVVTVAANALGVTISGDPQAWAGQVPSETIQALVAALLAHVLHAGRKRDRERDGMIDPSAISRPFGSSNGTSPSQY